MNLTRFFVLSLCLIGLSACQSNRWVYRHDVQQGNVFAQADIDTLSLGMPSDTVVEAIGEPVIRDPFHPNRWDYVSYHHSGEGDVTTDSFTLFFEDGKLSEIKRG